MQIVVLDGHTLNPGDLSWEPLDALGECEVFPRSSIDQLIERCRGATVLLTNKAPLDGAAIASLPDLQYIGVTATGYNIVDVAAAATHGIVVTNVPTYGTQSVAQMVFAHMLNLTQHVAEHATSVRRGDWAASQDFCYWNYPLIELAGMTLGIVGLGRIGLATAQIALAFGMRVLAHAPSPRPVPRGVELVDLDTLFSNSDIISLHCPLTDETRGLVGAARLRQMKSTALLINTSRGPLVDEAALAQALRTRQIAGAGLDVLGQEPPDAGSPLVAVDSCYVTPHIAWATRAARARLLQTTIDNVAAFLSGKPQNVVSPPSSG